MDAAIHAPMLRSVYSSRPAPCLYTYICVNSIGLIKNCLFTRVSGLCNHAYVLFIDAMSKAAVNGLLFCHRARVQRSKHSNIQWRIYKRYPLCRLWAVQHIAWLTVHFSFAYNIVYPGKKRGNSYVSYHPKATGDVTCFYRVYSLIWLFGAGWF